MDHCSHICSGVTHSSPSSLERVPKRLRGDELFFYLSVLIAQTKHRQTMADVRTNCISQFHQFRPWHLGFTMPCPQWQTIHIPFVFLRLRSRFFPGNVTFRNRLPTESFPDDYNLALFKSRVDLYLYCLTS